MHGWSPANLAQETTAVMLLVHTVAVVLYVCVGLILLRAVLLLRRVDERTAGFLAIATLVLLTSLCRAAWIGMLWVNAAPPPWLDMTILSLVYTGVMGTPIVVSAFYLPNGDRRGRRQNGDEWLHWSMFANSLAGAVVLFSGFARHNLALIYLGVPAICTFAVALLCLRIALLRNVQVRRRGLFLFAGFTSAGLLTIASVLVYGGRHHMLVRRSTATSTLLEFSSLLIVFGMLFVFANLRLADVIVKRVLRLSLWLCTALLVWIVTAALAHMLPLRAGLRSQALSDLLSVATIALFGAATPACLRLLDFWIDRWLFQQPDFDKAIVNLWERIVVLETTADVFQESANFVRETLSLSAVRIRAQEEPGESAALGAAEPRLHVLQTSSAAGEAAAGRPDVSMPIFLEGSATHCIVLTRGLLRPPLTAMELGFVERVAARVQVRLETILAEERRMANVRREAAFHEELADAELRALRAQINPHFLFNSLNTIADLAVTAPERAEQMTLRLSSVFRYVLVNTDKQFTSLEEEINFARSYLAIEEFRFGSRLQTHFKIDPNLLEQKVPTLLLQPLIENALKHGLAPKRGGGTIMIVARRTSAGVTLVVADDGVGLRSSAAVAGRANTHVGLDNIHRRLATAYQGEATFSLRAREGGGTEAVVTIRESGAAEAPYRRPL